MKKREREPLQEKRGYPNFDRAAIAGLKKSRKGKHHNLMLRILEDLRGSAPGFAVQIPLSAIEDVTVLNLRSAIVRMATKAGMAVETSSDDENFYVWKARS